MMPALQLRTARVDELALVQAIEVGASVRFGAIGMASLTTPSATDLPTLRAAALDGRLTVAVEGAVVVGFVLVSRHDDAAHLDEIDVAPDAGRRGIGRALVEHAAAWAAAQGFAAMTLTTFRDVPWNGPFYARAGFVELPEPLPPRLAAIRAGERARGLDLGPRIAMSRALEVRR